MQQLTQAPRDGLTADQVTGLIVSADTVWAAGLELLDDAGGITDISDDLLSGTITWDATAESNTADSSASPSTSSSDQKPAGVVYGSCQLQISRELAWGRDRVRAYVTATDPADWTVARFDLGVYVLNTPQDKPSETPQTYDVTGEDQLGPLTKTIDDSVTFAAGASYLDNARSRILAVVPGAVVLFDGTGAAKTLDDDAVYALVESGTPTELGIVNDQLAGAGYGPVWCDEEGAFRASPLVTPATRPVEWTFTADEPRVTLVAPERVLTEDLWNAYNAWKFIASGLSFTPEEGNGMYSPPDNTSDGPTSIDALGYRNQRTAWLSAGDQDSLVAQGDVIVAQDKTVPSTLEISTYPFPLGGHKDIAMYVDAALGGSRKVMAVKRVFDLGGNGKPPADTQWTFQGVHAA